MSDNKDNKIVSMFFNKNRSSSKNKEIVIDTLADSVEEELRKEKLEAIWKKHGNTIVVCAVSIISVASIYNVWTKKDLEEREAVSHAFAIAQNMLLTGHVQEAELQLKVLSQSNKKNYAALARMCQASIMLTNGDKNAVNEYLQIYENRKNDKYLRDISYVLYVLASLKKFDTNDITDQDVNDIKEKIAVLSKNMVNGSWKCLAKLVLSFCYMAIKDDTEANKILIDIAKDANTPLEIAEFARSLIV